jgi:hypothetical protein
VILVELFQSSLWVQFLNDSKFFVGEEPALLTVLEKGIQILGDKVSRAILPTAMSTSAVVSNSFLKHRGIVGKTDAIEFNRLHWQTISKIAARISAFGSLLKLRAFVWARMFS